MPAPLEFGGEESFEADPARLFDVLTNLDTMPAGIPDLVSSERVDEHTLRCVVKPGVAFLRGTLKLEIRLADLVPHESGTMHTKVEGIGVGMRIESLLKLEPEGSGTRLLWKATVSDLKGLIATVSPALIQAGAGQSIRQTWAGVRRRLGEA